jgi:hypothetical protein
MPGTVQVSTCSVTDSFCYMNQQHRDVVTFLVNTMLYAT